MIEVLVYETKEISVNDRKNNEVARRSDLTGKQLQLMLADCSVAREGKFLSRSLS